MRLALIGYGGVGKAFLQLLIDRQSCLEQEGLDIKVNYIINSKGGIYNPHAINCVDLMKFTKRGCKLIDYKDEGTSETTFEQLIERRDVEAVIILTPTDKETAKPGMTYIARALENGIHVITGDKGPVLLSYWKLNGLAVKNNVQFCIGCTTGGALPAINGGLIDLAGASILSIEGVLNGTTNFILDEMEQMGCSYKEALKKAQDSGVAETDPKLDVEGWDTAIKLLILTNVLMKEEKGLDDVHIEGITNLTAEQVELAKKEGARYKLIGKAVKSQEDIELSVQLQKVFPEHSLYSVCQKNKAVRYISDTLGELTIIGGASGVKPAAASILRDLINIYRGYKISRMKKT